MPEMNPFQPPQATVADQEQAIDIDSLNVSDKWKKRFHGIQKAGGPRMPNLTQLPKEDRRQISPFNVLAFLFGPFYYLAKGMWRKALAMSLICFVVLFVIGIILDALGISFLDRALGYGVAAVFAVRANIDYYKKMVLADNGWW